jgi:hypothetical protein
MYENKNILKKSLSAGELDKLDTKSHRSLSKRMSMRKRDSKRKTKRPMSKKRRFQKRIDEIKITYQMQINKLKNIIKKHHKFYEKHIKAITIKIRKIDNQMKSLKYKINDMNYSRKNYFHLDDVKSLGFLLNNNKYHSHGKVNGSRLYYRINEIMFQNREFREKIKLMKVNELLLEKSDKISFFHSPESVDFDQQSMERYLNNGNTSGYNFD